jgi:Low-density lipoprotein receptor domain class A
MYKCILASGNFTCPGIGMHTCENNRCIYERWFCDGEDDCRTGEDEDPKHCNSVYFRTDYVYTVTDEASNITTAFHCSP